MSAALCCQHTAEFIEVFFFHQASYLTAASEEAHLRCVSTCPRARSTAPHLFRDEAALREDIGLLSLPLCYC